MTSISGSYTSGQQPSTGDSNTFEISLLQSDFILGDDGDKSARKPLFASSTVENEDQPQEDETNPARDGNSFSSSSSEDSTNGVDDEVSHALPVPRRNQHDTGDPEKTSTNTSLMSNLPAFGSPLSPSDSGLPIAVSTPAYLFTSRFSGPSPPKISALSSASFAYSINSRSPAAAGGRNGGDLSIGNGSDGFANLGSEILASARAPFSKSPIASPSVSPAASPSQSPRQLSTDWAQGAVSDEDDEEQDDFSDGDEDDEDDTRATFESAKRDEERLAKLTAPSSPSRSTTLPPTKPQNSSRFSLLPSFILPTRESSKSSNSSERSIETSVRSRAKASPLTSPSQSPTPTPSVRAEELLSTNLRDSFSLLTSPTNRSKANMSKADEKRLQTPFEPVSRNLAKPPSQKPESQPFSKKSPQSLPKSSPSSTSDHTTTSPAKPSPRRSPVSQITSRSAENSTPSSSPRKMLRDLSRVITSPTASDTSSTRDSESTRERILRKVELLNKDIKWTKADFDEMTRFFKEMGEDIPGAEVGVESSPAKPQNDQEQVVDKVASKQLSVDEVWGVDLPTHRAVQFFMRMLWYAVIILLLLFTQQFCWFLIFWYKRHTGDPVMNDIGPEIALGMRRTVHRWM
ncbi:hypothetical protein BZA70DRAFT_279137 [Myxozyma melibiosi]|uniref:Uncharacterized protein n=1 Tax=Myxozyma melibiosi TaxID=54550 RepID=A0ABR1F5L6_9ASCO